MRADARELVPSSWPYSTGCGARPGVTVEDAGRRAIPGLQDDVAANRQECRNKGGNNRRKNGREPLRL